MSSLHDQNCCHQSGKPLTDDSINQYLSQLRQSWSFNNNHIEYDFSFKNFYETMAFVNAVAWIAHQQDHHPDLEVGYNHCLIRFSTHSVDGLSINDFICAAKVEHLL